MHSLYDLSTFVERCFLHREVDESGIVTWVLHESEMIAVEIQYYCSNSSTGLLMTVIVFELRNGTCGLHTARKF